jgi:exodeoxyribonuclease III
MYLLLCNVQKKNAGFTPQEREGFEKLLESGFTDVYRHFYPSETDCYTFWSYRNNARDNDVGWRLDYFLASPDILPRITHIYRRKAVPGSEFVEVTLIIGCCVLPN